MKIKICWVGPQKFSYVGEVREKKRALRVVNKYAGVGTKIVKGWTINHRWGGGGLGIIKKKKGSGADRFVPNMFLQ